MTSTDTPGTTASITDFGRDMWSYLTGKEATIDYTFVDMHVDVPKTTGADTEHATWKLNGTLRITTSDKDSAGAAREEA